MEVIGITVVDLSMIVVGMWDDDLISVRYLLTGFAPGGAEVRGPPLMKVFAVQWRFEFGAGLKS